MHPLTAVLTGRYCWRQAGHNHSDSPRVACRGTIWIDDQPVQDLDTIQRWLDDQGHDYRKLFHLDGDFLLSYRAPQDAFCLLYRPLTAVHTFYYRWDTEVLFWSTDIEALFDHPPNLDDLNHSLLPVLASAGEYDPELTPYRGIRCLRAGQCLSLSQTGQLHMEFDDFQWDDHSSLSFATAATLYRQHCAKAVRQAVSGFPRVGVLFSGGLDSAILACEARELGCQVEGFHWTWSQLPSFQPERQAAQQFAETLRLPLHLVDGQESIEAGGTYLQALSGLPLSYNHSFFTSFQQTARLAQQHDIPLLLTGHLGDTLFESEWLDGIQEKIHQRQWLSACGDLLSFFPRWQAFRVFGRLLTGPTTSQPLSGAVQRIERCDWLTTSAREQALASGQYTYQATQTPASAGTMRLYQAIMTNIHMETMRDTIRCQYALFPYGVAIKHPYLNRALIEYCLSLGRSHRTLFTAGETLSKPLARYAYLGRLPASLVRREVRLPYASVDEQYALQNREALASLFGEESYLVSLGIADRHTLYAIFADDDEVQSHAESLLPAAGVELWLRHLAGHSWRQPDPPAYRKSVFWKCLQPLTTHAGSCSLSLAPTVQAYEVHHQLILIERRTDRVLKLDARTHLFLRLVAHEQTIAHALTAFVDALGEPVDEEIWRAALRDLSGQGWIRLFPGGEEARSEKEAKHV